MNQTDRPSLSLGTEFEIEGRKREIHTEYWSHLQGMQELTDKARADYRLLSRNKIFAPPNPKSPHALRRLLASYAFRLFEMEASYFPSHPNSRHWLEVLSNRIISEIFGRVNEVEEAGKFRYVTLSYHGLDRVGMKQAMLNGMEEPLARIIRESEQKLYNETARHLMGEPARGATSVDTHAVARPDKSARMRFIKPLLAKRGWSVFMWATEAEVAYNTAAGYLDGKKTYAPTRVKLAKALGLDANHLPD